MNAGEKNLHGVFLSHEAPTAWFDGKSLSLVAQGWSRARLNEVVGAKR